MGHPQVSEGSPIPPGVTGIAGARPVNRAIWTTGVKISSQSLSMRFTYVLPFLVALQTVGVLTMEAPSLENQALKMVQAYHQYFDSTHPANTESEVSNATNHEPQKAYVVGEGFPGQILLPEFVEEILSHVDDLVFINDFIVSCKDYKREYAGLFFKLAQANHHKLLVQATKYFNRASRTFRGPWEGRSFEEIASLICKVVLSLPGNIDGDKIFSLIEPSDVNFARTFFMVDFQFLLKVISYRHKFDSVQQYLQFFRKISGGIKGHFTLTILPNSHFSKLDAFNAFIDFHSWTCDTKLVNNIIDLICQTFTDEKERKEQYCNLIAVGITAKRELVERLMSEKALESVDRIMPPVTEDTYFAQLLTRVEAHEDSDNLAIFAETIIYEILHGYDNVVSLSLCRHIMQRMLRNKRSDDDALLVFTMLLRSGYDVDMIMDDFKNSRSNSK